MTIRYSTTVKITLQIIDLLGQYVDEVAGVLVRFHGVEFGIVSVASDYALMFEGCALRLRDCTIPKATLRQIKLDLGL